LNIVSTHAEASEELTNDMQPNHLGVARIQNQGGAGGEAMPVVEQVA